MIYVNEENEDGVGHVPAILENNLEALVIYFPENIINGGRISLYIFRLKI